MGAEHLSIGILLVFQILIAASFGNITSHKVHRMICRKEATFKANGTGFVVKSNSLKFISTTNTPCHFTVQEGA